jgi:hypothetical protein
MLLLCIGAVNSIILIVGFNLLAVWGGSSLLKTQLRIMKDLHELKQNKTWDWGYFWNLSESDWPVK